MKRQNPWYSASFTDMVVYAIRIKGTEKYLPAKREGRSRGRGFSWDEPVLLGGTYGPRLHGTLIAARNALVSWLYGPYIMTKSQCLEETYPDYSVVDVPPRNPRNKEDMEIVPFMLAPMDDRIQLV